MPTAICNVESKAPLHSGLSLDIKNFFLHLFFVLYVSFNISDDVFEEKQIFSPQNGENWSMEKLEIFFCKS
jgi:hypothetical protein